MIAWLGALATSPLGGCGKGAVPEAFEVAVAHDALAEEPLPLPRLGELRLADLTPPELRLAAIPPLLGEVVRVAMAANFERAAEADPSACRASIGVSYTLIVNHFPTVAADAGEAHAAFEGELFCPAPGSQGTEDIDAFRLELDTRHPFGGLAGGSAEERLEEAVRAVVRDGADSLFGQLRMRRASDAELRTALGSSNHAGVLAEASSEAGERGLTDTVPELVRLTRHPNVRVATRAGAALGLLKVASPEVIGALVGMTEGPEPEKHLIAIHALADLGTPEARRYLESLALGHPSPALREIARERLRGPHGGLAPERPGTPEAPPTP